MRKAPPRRKWLTLVAIVAICFAGIQFIRPPLDNPPLRADASVPPAIKDILRKACYDCHSNETRLAWFDKPAPAYWLVAQHVKEGRQVLNFSTWDSLAPGDRKAKLFEGVNQLLSGDMPFPAYRSLHSEARLSDAEVNTLKDYLVSLTTVKPYDTALINTANKQFDGWINSSHTKPSVQPAPNGIAYIDGYQNWTAISTTDRFDNNTLRVIYGNDIAVKAIKEHRTQPWPDGTVFAKVAWDQLSDSSGHVIPGAFKQVEFMIKDAKQYAATDGWGWARWKGMQLTPYGKNASFVNECMGCHQPMKDYDFVFTTPFHLDSK